MATSGPSADSLLPAALARDEDAVRALVAALTPVIQVRVTRVLSRRGRLVGRHVRQEVRDLTQDVFVALFADDARVLRAWAPERGLSLVNFVGLVAEREAGAILKSGRRSPFSEEPTEGESLERRVGATSDLEHEVAERDFMSVLLERLEHELSPLGMQVFDLLWARQMTPDEVATSLGMSLDAIYAWQTRIKKKARALADELKQPRLEAR